MPNNGLPHSTGMGQWTETTLKPLYWNKTRTKIEAYLYILLWHDQPDHDHPGYQLLWVRAWVRLQIRSVWGIQDYIPLASNLLGVSILACQLCKTYLKHLISKKEEDGQWKNLAMSVLKVKLGGSFLSKTTLYFFISTQVLGTVVATFLDDGPPAGHKRWV